MKGKPTLKPLHARDTMDPNDDIYNAHVGEDSSSPTVNVVDVQFEGWLVEHIGAGVAGVPEVPRSPIHLPSLDLARVSSVQPHGTTFNS